MTPYKRMILLSIPLIAVFSVMAEVPHAKTGPELLRASWPLQELLRAWGPASGIALEGFDSEAGLKPNGAVLVWYESYPYALKTKHPSRVTFFLQGEPLVIIAVSVQPEQAVPIEEILATYGPEHRRVRHRLIDEADGLEAELSDCHDPKGSQESLVYSEIGLQAILPTAGADRVATLFFSRAILDGRKAFPRCKE